MSNFYIDSFKTFFKIGMFTFGGGYAMIPLIEQEVVDRHKWLGKEEFIDMIAVAQSCPGVMAINISAFIALPSFLVILAIAMFFHQFEDNRVVAAIFRGIRPAVVALIAVPTFNMAKSARITLTNCWIPIACALAIWMLGVSPIYVILIAGICGFVYGKYIKPTE